MVDSNHLKLLQQGVDVWNQWRKDNPDIKPKLIGTNLGSIDLRGFDLRGADLRSFDLSGADLRGADLRQADLSGAYLLGLNLSEFDLRGINLARARLVYVNLSGADLRGADLNRIKLGEVNLCRANLRNSNLFRVDLSGVDLSGVDLREASLRGVKLGEVDLRGVALDGADLRDANLCDVKLLGVDLSGVDLSSADLRGLNLRGVNLSNANLSGIALESNHLDGSKLIGADLSGVILNKFDLSGFDLSYTNLSRTQVLGTNFERAILTGACLEDWNINSATNFDSVICDYVYLKAHQQERRPREGIFKPGEFAALFQQAIDTVDLIFKDGIDWQVFFQSLQELRSQYADQGLAIQAIERKQGGAFVVRIEVSPVADKTAIERSAKELYKTKLALMEQQYRAKLKAKDREISVYKRNSASMEEIAKLLATRPITVEANAVADTSNRKTYLHDAQFAGGFAETVQGDQIGGTINNYGPNTEHITRLLTTLRNKAQTFPTDQKENANDILDDLERDLKEEQPDQNRISRRLKKLVALGATIGTIASGAAAISGDVSTFTSNVIELTKKLGIPIEQVQLPPSNTP